MSSPANATAGETADGWRAIVQLAPESLFLLDAAGIVRFANARMAEMLGYFGWELENRPLLDFVDRHALDPDAAVSATSLSGLRELPLRKRDGHPLLARLSVADLPQDGLTVGVLTDITHLREVEAALRASKSFCEQIIDSIADDLVVVDPETYRLVGANRSFLGRVAEDPQAVLQRTCYEVLAGRDSPCEVFGVACPVREAARTKRPSCRDREYADGAGNVRLVQVVTSPILDGDGQVHRVLRHEHDVTAKRKMERALEVRTRDLEKNHEEFKLLFEAARQMSGAASLPELVTQILETSSRILTTAELLPFVLSADGSHLLTMEECDDPHLRPLRTTVQKLEELGRLDSFARRLREMRDGSDPGRRDAGPLPAELRPFSRSYGRCAGFPFFARHRCVGYVLVGSAAGDGFTESDLGFLRALFAQLAGNIWQLVQHEEEVRELRARVAECRPQGNLIGHSHTMVEVYERIALVASSDATVLITGENGTGKELVARAIHARSHRHAGPFVVANCSAYSASLLETELFGHEKGAFTGAVKQRKGRIERARGGTLLLDEVGDISPATQVLLLRFLQDHCFERVGGEEILRADVRVLAATNKDLERELVAGRFREDLYYRLNVVTIHLPPLRDRKTDIPLLAEHFLRKHCDREGKTLRAFTPEALQALMDFDWPGNVRQLENAVSHAVILAQGDSVHSDHLPRFLRDLAVAPCSSSLVENERLLIARVLRECNGNKHEAARRLRVSRSTLYSKMRRHSTLMSGAGVQDRNAGVRS